LLLGTINAMYFGANAFLPPFLASSGRGDLVGPALTALNVGQLPASFLLLGLAGRLERRMWPYAAAAGLALASVLGMVFGGGLWILVSTGVLGFAAASGLIFALTLPPLLSDPEHVARTSAAMFTLSYAGAMLVAVVSGAVWDLTGVPAMAFLPIGLCSVVLVGAAFAMRAAQRLV
jgi:CP family cyanate transporter-like MFS transporter